MLYNIIETTQEVAIGAACVKALAYLVIIGVALFIAVTLLKNLKLLK